VLRAYLLLAIVAVVSLWLFGVSRKVVSAPGKLTSSSCSLLVFLQAEVFKLDLFAASRIIYLLFLGCKQLLRVKRKIKSYISSVVLKMLFIGLFVVKHFEQELVWRRWRHSFTCVTIEK
jgi:hypothetical protein